MKIRNIVILLVILAVLGGAYYAISRPGPEPPVEVQQYVWDIDMEEIDHVTISLPRENPVLTQSFIRIKQGDQFPWFFDDENNSPVDKDRWGGGIPLLLSGPGADRVLTDDATSTQLTNFGIAEPRMVIVLLLTNQQTMTITVGDPTPDGGNFYVKSPTSNAVATVDFTWYYEISGLVTDPPYAVSE